MEAGLDRVRTLLFTPGDDEHKLARAFASAADAVIVDLEDAVSDTRKDEARRLAAAALRAAAAGPLRLARLNAAWTPRFAGDLDWASALPLDGIVLPKASPEALELLAPLRLPLIAIVETADGVRRAWEIARSEQVAALMLGTVDLAAELGLEARADGLELHFVRSKLVVDSAAAELRAPFDGVHLRLDDEQGLRRDAELARSLGMGGKACIHPSQLAVVSAVFASSDEQLAWARLVLDAAEAARADGRGAIAVDGAMVDAAVVARARRVIRESGGDDR